MGVNKKPAVLMVTIPVCPPWDNASKNRVYDLALHTNEYKIHILTKKNYSLPTTQPNLVSEKIYCEQDRFWQKILLILRLIQKDDHIQIYHFFFQPTLITATFFKLFLKIKKKKSVQTVLNVFAEHQSPGKYLFGDVILVSSNYMKEILTSVTASEVIKINPAIDCERFAPTSVANYLRKTFDTVNVPVVLYPGEYTKTRGINQLLLAVKLVTEKIPQIKFIFACRIFSQDDSDRERLVRNKAAQLGIIDSILFLHTFDDMPSLLKSADIVIFPTLTMLDKMDIPITLLEALSLEKPIIISDIAPLNEIMKSEVGIKITPGDYRKLSNAIVYLISDANKRKIMGKNGRQVVLRHFNIKENVKLYEQLYKKVLQKI